MNPSYYSRGSITGTVIRFDPLNGWGYLDVDGYWYKLKIMHGCDRLKWALYKQARKNRPIALKYWPTTSVPELLNKQIKLKVTRFTEAQDIDYLDIHGIVHQSSSNGCIIRIPSIPRNKNYYSLVNTEKTFDRGVRVRIAAYLNSGKIVARTISLSNTDSVCS